jgi:predicted Na+-dependent transporter
MADLLEKLLGLTIAVFMAGSLLERGLKLDLQRASHALRDIRFMVTALFWSFVVGPALAILLARRLPLAEPYALASPFWVLRVRHSCRCSRKRPERT